MAREPEGATFEPVGLGGGARSAGLGVAWLAALVGLAGIAAANVVPDDRIEADVAARASEAPAGDGPIAILDVIEGRSFDPAGGGISRRLEVTAHWFVRAARVRVTLEGREDRILGTVVRELVRQPPTTRPTVPGTFLAAFELPAWRSGGMWITVTAFDAAGERLGRIRERVEVYPIAPRAYADRTFRTFEPGA